MQKTNTYYKDKNLVAILQQTFGRQMPLARIKFLAKFICGLCQVQTVNLKKISQTFSEKIFAESSYRRIQRFLQLFHLDAELIARFIFSLLNLSGTVKLSLDRTNWKFGKFNHNILVLAVIYNDTAFPLLFSLLPKRGNSNTNERIMLINRFLKLFGKNSIEFLVADREFIGKQWLDYLKQQKITYYIRIRNNFEIFLPHKNKPIKAAQLFSHLKYNQFTNYPKKVRMHDVDVYLSAMKIHEKNKNDTFCIIVSIDKLQVQQKYQQRWLIEMCFKSMKSSGFNLENTHLQSNKKMEKLFLMVMIAFLWCYKVGVFLHQHIKPIRTKSHGRKSISTFKYGLNYIAQLLFSSNWHKKLHIFKFLSCT